MSLTNNRFLNQGGDDDLFDSPTTSGLCVCMSVSVFVVSVGSKKNFIFIEQYYFLHSRAVAKLERKNGTLYNYHCSLAEATGGRV